MVKKIVLTLMICLFLTPMVMAMHEVTYNLSEEQVITMKEEIFAAKDTYLTVGDTGCEFKTIKDALAAVDGRRNVIWVMDEIHTESNIQVDKDVTIRGFGPKRTIVQAAANPDLADGRVFKILKDTSVRLEGMTIQHGKVIDFPRGGGGIQNYGNLFVDLCVIQNNLATYGVGVHNRGQLEMRDSAIIGNRSMPLPLEAKLHGVDCVGSGGGLKVQADSEALLINCLIADNYSVVMGGGIHVSCEGRASLINCTIIANYAEKAGGGINVRGDLKLVHCTITENQGLKGSGIYSLGKMELFANLIAENKTFAGNKARDLVLGSSGAGYYGRGFLEKNEYNFIGHSNIECFASGESGLMVLADYGGSTMTCALANDSPAIGAIPEGIFFVDTDQRGMPRNGPADIGAYETQ